MERRTKGALVLLNRCADLLSASMWTRFIAKICVYLTKPDEVLDFILEQYRARSEIGRLIAHIAIFTESLSHPACVIASSFRQRRINEIRDDEGCYRKLECSKIVLVNSVPYFGENHLTFTQTRHLAETFVAEVNDAVLLGGSFAVFSGRTLWNLSKETELPYRSTRYSTFFHALPDGKRYICLEADRAVDSIHTSAILIASRVSHSYFHWMCECLPKLVSIDQLPDYAGLPIAVRTGMPKQNYELLDLVNVQRRRVIPMQGSDLFRFDKLIVPSTRSYCPDDSRLRVDRAVVDPDAISELRKTLFKGLAGLAAREPENSVLWISRSEYAQKHRARDVVNAEQVERYLRGVGAKVLCPELCSIRDQFSAFSNARVLVLIAGAAAANMVFCRPETRIILLAPSENASPGLFTSIAEALGLKVTLLLGKGIPDPQRSPSHWSFEIQLSDLESAVQWAHAAGVTPAGYIPLE